jgi:CBS domain-containing protein
MRILRNLTFDTFSVMTPNPDCIPARCSILDALKEMHDKKYFHLPVRGSDDKILGLVDVMELLNYSSGQDGGKGWKEFFASAGDEDFSDYSSEGTLSPLKPQLAARTIARRASANSSEQDLSDIVSVSIAPSTVEFALKVTDVRGNTHRIKCAFDSYAAVLATVAEKVEVGVGELVIKYLDEDKDAVIINSDASLKDAVEFAKASGQAALKISASTLPKQSKVVVLSSRRWPILVGGLLGTATVVAMAALMILKKK